MQNNGLQTPLKSIIIREYNYCYCTKSSHFKHVLNEALKNDIHIETSSAFDIDIVENLKSEGKINNNTLLLVMVLSVHNTVTNIAAINNGTKTVFQL